MLYQNKLLADLFLAFSVVGQVNFSYIKTKVSD